MGLPVGVGVAAGGLTTCGDLISSVIKRRRFLPSATGVPGSGPIFTHCRAPCGSQPADENTGAYRAISVMGWGSRACRYDSAARGKCVVVLKKRQVSDGMCQAKSELHERILQTGRSRGKNAPSAVSIIIPASFPPAHSQNSADRPVSKFPHGVLPFRRAHGRPRFLLSRPHMRCRQSGCQRNALPA